MRTYVVFTGSGPILILTCFGSAADSGFVAKLAVKGIAKFIAYEVPLERVHAIYGRAFDVVAADLAGSDDLRVLDFNGHHIFAGFSLDELGEAVKVGG